MAQCAGCGTQVEFGAEKCHGCGVTFTYPDPTEQRKLQEQKKKRETQNIYLALIVGTGGIILTGFMQSVIPAIIGIVVAAIIYQRDQ